MTTLGNVRSLVSVPDGHRIEFLADKGFANEGPLVKFGGLLLRESDDVVGDSGSLCDVIDLGWVELATMDSRERRRQRGRTAMLGVLSSNFDKYLGFGSFGVDRLRRLVAKDVPWRQRQARVDRALDQLLEDGFVKQTIAFHGPDRLERIGLTGRGVAEAIRVGALSV